MVKSKQSSCKDLLGALINNPSISNHYPEIKKIYLRVDICQDVKDFYIGSNPWIPSISGFIPENLIQQPNSEAILKGIFGHELSHIVLGMSFKILPLYLIDKFLFMKYPELYDRFDGCFNALKTIENLTDEETIRRGLGDELYQAKVYLECLQHRFDGLYMPAGYWSYELLPLIKQTS